MSVDVWNAVNTVDVYLLELVLVLELGSHIECCLRCVCGRKSYHVG